MLYISDMFLLPLVKTFLNSNLKVSKAEAKPKFSLFFSHCLTLLFWLPLRTSLVFTLHSWQVNFHISDLLTLSSSTVNVDARRSRD